MVNQERTFSETTVSTSRPYAGAADLQAMINEENALTGRNEGYTDPIVTHPAFRRQGLARALLLTGLCLLKQRGVDAAVLGTWGENAAMQQTAKAVGFHVQSTTIFFTKQSS